MTEGIEVYKGILLVPHKTGVDVVNPVTGKWRTAKSKHQAKWYVTLSARLHTQFSYLLSNGTNTPLIQGGPNIVLPLA